MNLRKISRGALISLATTSTLLASACGSSDKVAAPLTVTATETTTETTTVTRSSKTSPTTAETPTEPATTTVEATTTPPETTPPPRPNSRSGLTTSQQNAVAKASDYLSISAFSRKGLIDQLVYEGFSTNDATVGVDNLSTNWTDQAAKKAAEYMSISAFSEQGLVDQLIFDGFTPSQAQSGAASQF
ncbi:MAG: Ltp family lipoprotein [Gordonia sp. (in: high G+C Gram-positive bacteria)]